MNAKKHQLINNTKMYSMLSEFSPSAFTTILPRKHKVGFMKSGIIIYPIPKADEKRGMGPGYFRGLIVKCSKAQEELYNCFNVLTCGGIIPLSEDPEDDKIKVNNPDVPWDEDDSPLRLLEIYKTHDKVKSEIFEILLKNCQGQKRNTIRIIPFQTCFIKVNCSGSGFKTVISRKIIIMRTVYKDLSEPKEVLQPQLKIQTPMKDEIKDMMESINNTSFSLPSSFSFDFENMSLV